MTNQEIAEAIGEKPRRVCGMDIYPDYANDAEAALRVLAWMGSMFSLWHNGCEWTCTHHTGMSMCNHFYAPTAPAAIIAALEWFLAQQPGDAK